MANRYYSVTASPEYDHCKGSDIDKPDSYLFDFHRSVFWRHLFLVYKPGLFKKKIVREDVPFILVDDGSRIYELFTREPFVASLYATVVGYDHKEITVDSVLNFERNNKPTSHWSHHYVSLAFRHRNSRMCISTNLSGYPHASEINAADVMKFLTKKDQYKKRMETFFAAAVAYYREEDRKKAAEQAELRKAENYLEQYLKK